jgi:hypothetical protein
LIHSEQEIQMKAVKLVSAILAAAAVSGGISVAVAQNVMPQTPARDTGTKKDIEATGAMRSPPPAPAAATSSSSAPADTSSAASTSEPAAQPTRG